MFLILVTHLAILICLEHSFWLSQQGSSPTKGFTEALNTYLKDQHTLVYQRLEEYLTSKGTNDWLTTKYRPTHNECAEFRRIVLDNLLRMADSVFFNFVLLIQYLQPVLNPPFDNEICISATSLAQSEWINKIPRFCTAATNISYFPIVFQLEISFTPYVIQDDPTREL